MLLTTTIEKKITETVSLDIDLPYYSKQDWPVDGIPSAHYRINENGSVTSCYVSGNLATISTETKSAGSYGRTLKQALEGKEISHQEFIDKMEKARQFHEKEMTGTIN